MRNEEWIIEVDEQDGFVGKIDRVKAHDPAKLVLHREVMTLLFSDLDHKHFLLQKRSLSKKQLPGLWTLSATGHVDMADMSDNDNDGYLRAATRESFEEIGVKTKNLEIKGKIVQKNSKNWAIMGLVVGEYEGQLALDYNEVSEVRVFDVNSVRVLSDKLTPGAKSCLEFLGLLN